VVRLVHVPQRGVPQRAVRPPRPELHPHLHRQAIATDALSEMHIEF
jgi:hypothetical protein